MTFTASLTMERALVRMRIAGGRLTLHGVIREVTTGTVLREFQEDVTDQLTQNQRDGIAALAARAQQWLDARPL